MKERIFRFKQFSVSHRLSAMKVGVDGVLLGAWADVADTGKVLDVGTGCGVIALLVAQRSPSAIVTAIDLHQPSVDEARENFDLSPWSERLTAKKVSFQDFISESKFDLIISNPPFFDSGADSKLSPRMAARHAGELSPQSLLSYGVRLLAPEGRIALICPAGQEDVLVDKAAEAGLAAVRLTHVHGVEGKPAKRLLAEFVTRPDNDNVEIVRNSLNIVDSNGCYTKEYRRLTGAFYLHF